MKEKCYQLNTDVYVVDGAERSAIYDLNTGHLYSISRDVSQLIAHLIDNPIAIELDSEQKNILNEMLANNLLVSTEKPGIKHDIKELMRDYPLDFAWIEVTRKCNMACPFCYESSSPSCEERMSFDEFKIVVKNLAEAGVDRIQFIGGEPTILKGELMRMIEYCREHYHFEMIEVYSNGILIDDNWCQFFKKHDIRVALSIHSYIAEEHDKHVNYKGSHKKVERAVRALNSHDIPYRVGTVKSKSCNVGEPNEGTSYRIGAPDNPRLAGRADFNAYDLEMFRTKAITKDSKRAPLTKETVTNYVSGHQCFLHDIYIDTKLTVYPCVMERRQSYGNLKDKPLVEMLSSKFRYMTKDNIEGCKNCEYRYACFDCRPDANNRGFYQKPWFCTYEPTKGIWHSVESVYEYLQKTSQKDNLSKIPIVVE